MKLSVIIPMYNESAIVCDTVRTLDSYLSSVYAAGEYELIFVDDGSTDGCADKARALRRELPSLRVEGYTKNHGKGYAVRTGMLAARGDVRLFTDCDLAYGVEFIPAFREKLLADGADIVIGSRNLDKSGYEDYTLLRRIMSKTYIKLICVTAGFRHSDSQCGIKCFTAESAGKLFDGAIIDGFAFDLEALMRAEKYGYRISELPVKVINHRESKVHVVRDTLRMLRDVRRIKKSLKGMDITNDGKHKN